MRGGHREDSMQRLSMEEISFKGPLAGSCQNCLDQGILRVRIKENEYEYEYEYESLAILR